MPRRAIVSSESDSDEMHEVAPRVDVLSTESTIETLEERENVEPLPIKKRKLFRKPEIELSSVSSESEGDAVATLQLIKRKKAQRQKSTLPSLQSLVHEKVPERFRYQLVDRSYDVKLYGSHGRYCVLQMLKQKRTHAIAVFELWGKEGCDKTLVRVCESLEEGKQVFGQRFEKRSGVCFSKHLVVPRKFHNFHTDRFEPDALSQEEVEKYSQVVDAILSDDSLEKAKRNIKSILDVSEFGDVSVSEAIQMIDEGEDSIENIRKVLDSSSEIVNVTVDVDDIIQDLRFIQRAMDACMSTGSRVDYLMQMSSHFCMVSPETLDICIPGNTVLIQITPSPSKAKLLFLPIEAFEMNRIMRRQFGFYENLLERYAHEFGSYRLLPLYKRWKDCFKFAFLCEQIGRIEKIKPSMNLPKSAQLIEPFSEDSESEIVLLRDEVQLQVKYLIVSL